MPVGTAASAVQSERSEVFCRPNNNFSSRQHSSPTSHPLSTTCEIRIGTFGFHYKPWIGPFYPTKTPAAKMLDFYLVAKNATREEQ